MSRVESFFTAWCHSLDWFWSTLLTPALRFIEGGVVLQVLNPEPPITMGCLLRIRDENETLAVEILPFIFKLILPMICIY